MTNNEFITTKSFININLINIFDFNDTDKKLLKIQIKKSYSLRAKCSKLAMCNAPKYGARAHRDDSGFHSNFLPLIDIPHDIVITYLFLF